MRARGGGGAAPVPLTWTSRLRHRHKTATVCAGRPQGPLPPPAAKALLCGASPLSSWRGFHWSLFIGASTCDSHQDPPPARARPPSSVSLAAHTVFPAAHAVT